MFDFIRRQSVAHAVDDRTSIDVTDGTVDVVSEGRRKSVKP